MSANAKIVDPVPGNSTLVRPRFSPGLLLRDDDLRQGVDYTRDLSRLLFRSLFGCGVICGLAVETRLACGKLVVTVDRGIGLTCLGDPVEVPKPTLITIDPTCGKELPPRLWVILCRTEKCCAPRTAVCSCEDEDASSVCTREHEGFEIHIREDRLECACGCPEPAAPPTPRKKSVARAAALAVAPNPKPASSRVQQSVTAPTPTESCWCADPCSPCYEDHYAGECGCECCDCECVVLALLTRQAGDPKTGEPDTWKADHRVRRFVRPVLMRDPQVWKEQNPDKDPCQKSESV
jgi:hypothetical protein